MSVLRFNHYSDVDPAEWPLHFFSPEEVADSRDGSIVLDLSFGARMDAMRRLYRKPIIVTSWYRTPEHDRSIGGKGNHTTGAAVDIRAPVEEAWDLMRCAYEMRFRRIGHNEGVFIHLDDLAEQGKPSPRHWGY